MQAGEVIYSQPIDALLDLARQTYPTTVNTHMVTVLADNPGYVVRISGENKIAEYSHDTDRTPGVIGDLDNHVSLLSQCLVDLDMVGIQVPDYKSTVVKDGVNGDYVFTVQQRIHGESVTSMVSNGLLSLEQLRDLIEKMHAYYDFVKGMPEPRILSDFDLNQIMFGHAEDALEDVFNFHDLDPYVCIGGSAINLAKHRSEGYSYLLERQSRSALSLMSAWETLK